MRRRRAKIIAETPHPRRARVLVIDDERPLAGAIERLLSRRYDVEVHTDAREALRAVKAGSRFDVILCDVAMPAMDGREFHRRLRRVAPEQAERTAFLTRGAAGDGADHLAGLPNAWLEKPPRADELHSLVRLYVD